MKKKLLLVTLIALLCSCSFGAKMKVIATLSESNFINSGLCDKSGNYVYMTSYGSDYFHVIDVKQPKNPFLVSQITDPNLNGCEGVRVSGNYAYVAALLADSFLVIDISDPTSPSVVESLTDAVNLDGAQNVRLSGNDAFVTCGEGDMLTIVDITDPLNISVRSSVHDADDLENPVDLVLDGDYAWVVCGDGGTITSIDISDLDNPAVDDSAALSSPVGLAISGNYAYVSTSTSRLYSYDISDPNDITHLDDYWDTSYKIIHLGRGVQASGNNVYMGSSGNGDAFITFDVSDPTDIKLYHYIKTGGDELNGADGIIVEGDYSYIPCWTSGNFTIVSLKGSNSYRSRSGGGSHRPRYEF